VRSEGTSLPAISERWVCVDSALAGDEPIEASPCLYSTNDYGIGVAAVVASVAAIKRVALLSEGEVRFESFHKRGLLLSTVWETFRVEKERLLATNADVALSHHVENCHDKERPHAEGLSRDAHLP
jgi:hypothetical protein